MKTQNKHIDKLIKGGNVSAVDADGRTALHHLALEGDDVASAKKLLNAQIDRNIEDKDGLRAMDIAGEQGRKGMFKLLRDVHSRYLMASEEHYRTPVKV